MAACGGPEGDVPGGEAATTSTTTTASPDTAPSTPPPGTGATGPDGLPSGPSALTDMRSSAFPEPLVDPASIRSGGPPPDGIPPIDAPAFVSIEEADRWLEDPEAVVVVSIDGDARAYPVQVLIWHEIVNDVVGGVPVAVTYCPLCNSAISWVRTVRGVETTFGTSGSLYASALVMYDRATESLWTHFDGQAVVGLLAGDRLEPVPSPLLAWADFRSSHPDGVVLDRDATGFTRNYGANPYLGYDEPSSTPFLFSGQVDDRARAMQRVVGVRTDGAARAWTLDAVGGGDAAATNTFIGSDPLVIFWKAGQASAIDARTVDGGRDVGSVGVFSALVRGESLTFDSSGGLFGDEETGSTWDITGLAVDGPLKGERLTRVPHLDTFWFAWATYAPDTDLVEE